MTYEFVVTEVDAAEASEVPATFVAVTVNVYAVPPVSPETVMVPADAPDRVPVFPPGLDVAVYFVIGVPPLDAGAVNATVAVVFPVTVTAPMPGFPGVVNVVTEGDWSEASEVPTPFVAVTVNV
jgi:hypothetical protein